MERDIERKLSSVFCVLERERKREKKREIIEGERQNNRGIDRRKRERKEREKKNTQRVK